MSNQKLRFVIIEKDSFVARDMQDGLKAAIPDCDIKSLSGAEEALDIVKSCTDADDARAIIVTKLSLDQIDSTGLTQIARHVQADIVVRVGDDPPGAIAARGWFTLASPFTWDDLAALAVDLCRRTAAA